MSIFDPNSNYLNKGKSSESDIKRLLKDMELANKASSMFFDIGSNYSSGDLSESFYGKSNDKFRANDSDFDNITSHNFMGVDATKYSKYGVPVQRGVDYDLLRAQRQKWTEQTGRSALQALSVISGEAISGVGAMYEIGNSAIREALGMQVDFENALMRLGDQIQDKTREATPIYRTNPNKAFDISDFGWWAEGFPSVASSLGMMIPATGTVKLISAVGKIARAGKFGATIAKVANTVDKVGDTARFFGKTALSAGIMRNSENLKISMQVYNEVKDEVMADLYNMSDDDYNTFLQNNPAIVKDVLGKQGDINDRGYVAREIATNAGWKAYKVNASNYVFDFVQVAPVFRAYKGTTSIKNNPAAIKNAQARAMGKEVAMSKGREKALTMAHKLKDIATLEVLTEGIEEIINNIGEKEGVSYAKELFKHNKDKTDFPTRLSEYLRDPFVWEEAFWGAIGGGIFSGAARIQREMSPHMDKLLGNPVKLDNYSLKQRLNEINSRGLVFADLANKIKNIDDNLSKEDRAEVLSDMVNDLGFHMGMGASRVGNANLLIEQLQSPEFLEQMSKLTELDTETSTALLSELADVVTNTEIFYNRAFNNIFQSRVPEELKSLFISKYVNIELNRHNYSKKKQATDNLISEYKNSTDFKILSEKAMELGIDPNLVLDMGGQSFLINTLEKEISKIKNKADRQVYESRLRIANNKLKEQHKQLPEGVDIGVLRQLVNDHIDYDTLSNMSTSLWYDNILNENKEEFIEFNKDKYKSATETYSEYLKQLADEYKSEFISNISDKLNTDDTSKLEEVISGIEETLNNMEESEDSKEYRATLNNLLGSAKNKLNKLNKNKEDVDRKKQEQDEEEARKKDKEESDKRDADEKSKKDKESDTNEQISNDNNPSPSDNTSTNESTNAESKTGQPVDVKNQPVVKDTKDESTSGDPVLDIADPDSKNEETGEGVNTEIEVPLGDINLTNYIGFKLASNKDLYPTAIRMDISDLVKLYEYVNFNNLLESFNKEEFYKLFNEVFDNMIMLGRQGEYGLVFDDLVDIIAGEFKQIINESATPDLSQDYSNDLILYLNEKVESINNGTELLVGNKEVNPKAEPQAELVISDPVSDSNINNKKESDITNDSPSESNPELDPISDPESNPVSDPVEEVNNPITEDPNVVPDAAPTEDISNAPGEPVQENTPTSEEDSVNQDGYETTSHTPNDPHKLTAHSGSLQTSVVETDNTNTSIFFSSLYDADTKTQIDLANMTDEQKQAYDMIVNQVDVGMDLEIRVTDTTGSALNNQVALGVMVDGEFKPLFHLMEIHEDRTGQEVTFHHLLHYGVSTTWLDSIITQDPTDNKGLNLLKAIFNNRQVIIDNNEQAIFELSQSDAVKPFIQEAAAKLNLNESDLEISYIVAMIKHMNTVLTFNRGKKNGSMENISEVVESLIEWRDKIVSDMIATINIRESIKENANNTVKVVSKTSGGYSFDSSEGGSKPISQVVGLNDGDTNISIYFVDPTNKNKLVKLNDNSVNNEDPKEIITIKDKDASFKILLYLGKNNGEVSRMPISVHSNTLSGNMITAVKKKIQSYFFSNNANIINELSKSVNIDTVDGNKKILKFRLKDESQLGREVYLTHTIDADGVLKMQFFRMKGKERINIDASYTSFIFNNTLRRVSIKQLSNKDKFTDLEGNVYNNYSEYVIKSDALVSNVQTVRDSKGNLISNTSPSYNESKGRSHNMIIRVGSEVTSSNPVAKNDAPSDTSPAPAESTPTDKAPVTSKKDTRESREVANVRDNIKSNELFDGIRDNIEDILSKGRTKSGNVSAAYISNNYGIDSALSKKIANFINRVIKNTNNNRQTLAFKETPKKTNTSIKDVGTSLKVEDSVSNEITNDLFDMFGSPVDDTMSDKSSSNPDAKIEC